MKWNTRPFTNIDDEVFVGKYNGIEFEVQPGEMRPFPTELSEHIAKQLASKISVREEGGMDMAPLLSGILGEEIKTADDNRAKSFKEEVEDHEREFKEMQERKKKEDLLKKEKAINIAKKNE